MQCTWALPSFSLSIVYARYFVHDLRFVHKQYAFTHLRRQIAHIRAADVPRINTDEKAS